MEITGHSGRVYAVADTVAAVRDGMLLLTRAIEAEAAEKKQDPERYANDVVTRWMKGVFGRVQMFNWLLGQLDELLRVILRPGDGQPLPEDIAKEISPKAAAQAVRAFEEAVADMGTAMQMTSDQTSPSASSE